ncbi:flavin reductase [Hominifimenecus sp. rT4P-3]|uniref:flavin reductase n=1 Tax=Hominifimenecus sp. rT4P-3 TaxID=3242979 RepID=UPI003DA3A47A
MKEKKMILPAELLESPFTLIGKEWMLVAAEKDGKVNAMTAAWGGLGVLWGKNVAFVFIRPQRYTKEFVDAADTMSLTFFGESYRNMMNYMGKVSGRDEDKVEKAGLTVAYEGETPYFEEARLTMIGRKLYAQELKPECFVDGDSTDKWYPEKDFHTMYVIELEKIWMAE